MSAAASEAGSSTAARPVAFDDLFGWFSPGTSRRGVVLCGTFGSEQLAAYRAWRDLGDAIAETGCAMVRFDYPGEGDSGDRDGERVAAWIAAIRRAIRYLREEAGVEEIALVGLRLGGTLAALAARDGGVDRLVLLAPFATGRAYLREMALRSSMIDRLPDGTPFPEVPGILTVAGFRFGPDLVADLAALALDPATAVPVPDVLLLGDASGLSARYAAAGSRVAGAPFPGLAQLVAKPLFPQAPDPAVSAVVDFVAEGARPRQASPRPAAPSVRIGGAAWSEEPARFGPGIFGILCRPRETALRGPAVLFLTSGLNVRSGYGRQTTLLARRFAAMGVASLRIDLRGIGDSAERPDQVTPLFNLDALTDVGAALDHLAGREAGPLVLVGFCSGAHLAFHAACRDPRVAAAVLVNMPCFDWDGDGDVETTVGKPFRSAATYAALIRRGSAWRRVLRGEVRVAAILTTLARRAWSQAKRRAAGLLRPVPAGRTVAGRVSALRRRGTRLLLVYSAGDVGVAEARTHLGRSPADVALLVGAPIRILDGADHNLGAFGALDAFASHLEALLTDLRPFEGSDIAA